MKRIKSATTKKSAPKKRRSKRPHPGVRAALHQSKSSDWWLVVGVDREVTEAGALRDVTISVKVPGKPRDVVHAINIVSELTSAAINIPQDRKEGVRLKFRPKMPGMRAAILFAYFAELDMPDKATKAMIASELAACGISLDAGGPSNDQLQEMMKSNGPPQSWFDEDHTGLY